MGRDQSITTPHRHAATPHPTQIPSPTPMINLSYAALRLDASPRRATPKGHKTFIYYTTLPQKGLPTSNPSSAFVAHVEIEDGPEPRGRRFAGSRVGGR